MGRINHIPKPMLPTLSDGAGINGGGGVPVTAWVVSEGVRSPWEMPYSSMS